MTQRGIIYIILSTVCFGFAAFLIIAAKPFKPADIYSEVKLEPAVHQEEQQVQETENKAQTAVHNYDTKYGDKDVSAEDTQLCQDFTKAAFNIGYRNIINSRDAYVSGITSLFKSGSVDHGAYHFSPEQFADFMANMVEDNMIQLDAAILPQTYFEKDNVAYVNCMMNLTVHAGEDLSQLSKFFDTTLEINSPMQIPVCIMISRTNGNVVGFKPVQVMPE